MPIGTLGEGQDEPRERIIIAQSMPQPQQMPQQMPVQYPQEQAPQKVKGPSITKRLLDNSKAKVLNFHYGMLERKRKNAEMKRRNPRAYAKLAAKRKEQYNIMKTPNIFDGRGNTKW